MTSSLTSCPALSSNSKTLKFVPPRSRARNTPSSAIRKECVFDHHFRHNNNNGFSTNSLARIVCCWLSWLLLSWIVFPIDLVMTCSIRQLGYIGVLHLQAGGFLSEATRHLRFEDSRYPPEGCSAEDNARETGLHLEFIMELSVIIFFYYNTLYVTDKFSRLQN